jgi:hypothetical protein
MNAEFSAAVSGRSAWKGADLTNDQSWMHRWSDQALAEIDQAVRKTQRAGLQPTDVTAQDFAIPSAKAELARIANELEDGTGFVLLRGLPVHKYTEEEVELIFCGVGAHLGPAISQNPRGQKLVRVEAEEGAKRGQPNVRLYTTDSRLHFHTDNTDIIALCCLRPAKEGGQSSVVSSMSVWNAIRDERPAYLSQLLQGFVYDMMGEERKGVGSVTKDRIPVFSHHAGKLSCRYSRNSINLAPRKSGIALTPREVEVLDFFESVAERADLRFDMYLEPGDMQLLNNHTVLHARTEYVDFEDRRLKRSLLRLWLTSLDGRPLNPVFENRYGDDYSFRLGIPVREASPA